MESNFNEKVERKKAKEQQQHDSSSCESLSSFDSQASRVNFWKDINTKDGDYGNSAIFIKSKNEAKEKALVPKAKMYNEEFITHLKTQQK